jgi:hypothetical protein
MKKFTTKKKIKIIEKKREREIEKKEQISLNNPVGRKTKTEVN